MPAFNIRSTRGRASLPQRIDPYWEALGDGLSLGCYVGRMGMAWKARRPATDGKRWHKTTLGQIDSLTYAEARRAAHAWVDGAEAETADHGRALTVAMACVEWRARKTAEAGGISARKTRDGWASYAARIGEWFGPDTPLDDITVAKCEAWRDRGNRSASAGDRDLATAKAVFSAGARALGYDGKQDWVDAKKKGEKIIAIERADAGKEGLGGRALSLLETQLLIAAAGDIDPNFADYLRAMFLTLQRPQALRMADVRDFDRDNAKLRLRRGKNAGKKGVIKIDLFGSAVELFTRLAGRRNGRAPLLTDADGNRWSENFQFTRFPVALAAAGLPNTDGVTLYNVRHSAISWAATKGGIDALTIAKMADTSVEIILKHYFRHTEKLGRGPLI